MQKSLSQQSLNIKKRTFIVTVILIAIVVNLTAVRAEVILNDGFENKNLANWTVSGSPIIVATPVENGSYAVQFNLSSSMSYIQAAFPKTNTVTLEFYFQTNTISPSSNTDIMLGTIIDNQGPLISIILSRDGASELDWVFSYPTNGGIQMKIISSDIQTNMWYKFDIAISVSNSFGSFNFSINDSPVFSVSDVHLNWDPTSFRLGNVLCNGYSNGNMYIDDVMLSSSLIIPQPYSSILPSFPPTSASNLKSITEPTSSPTPFLRSTQNPAPLATTSITHSAVAIELPSLIMLSLFLSILIVAIMVFMRKRHYGIHKQES